MAKVETDKTPAPVAQASGLTDDQRRLLKQQWKPVRVQDEIIAWKDPHGGKKSYLNDLMQHIFPNPDREYTEQEALAIQDAYEETAKVLAKRRAAEEARRQQNRGLTGS